MRDYQKQLYASYHSTHVAQRKGADTAATLQLRGRIWDASWGPHLPRDKSVAILDVACGNGAMVWWLRSRGYVNTAGVDVSREVVEHGRRLGVEGLVVADAFEHLASLEAAGAYDVVIMRDVLEHVSKDETLEVLASARRALRPGGLLFLHVPNADSPFFGRIRYGDFTHETAFTPSSLSQVLLASGFGEPHCLSSRPVGLSAPSRARAAVFRVVEGLYRLLTWCETGQRPKVVTQNVLAIAAVSPLRSSLNHSRGRTKLRSTAREACPE